MSKGYSVIDRARCNFEDHERAKTRGAYTSEASMDAAARLAHTYVRVDDGDSEEVIQRRRDKAVEESIKSVHRQAYRAEKTDHATRLRDTVANFDRREVMSSLKRNKEILPREKLEEALKTEAGRRRQRVRMFAVSTLVYRDFSIDNLALAVGLMLGSTLSGGLGRKTDAEGFTRKDRKAQRMQKAVDRFESWFDASDGVTDGLGVRRPRAILDKVLIPMRDKAMLNAKTHVPLTAKDVSIRYLGIVTDTLDRLSVGGSDELAIRRDASQMVQDLYEVAAGSGITNKEISEMTNRMIETMDSSSVPGLADTGMWVFPVESQAARYASRGYASLPSETALHRAYGKSVKYVASGQSCVSSFESFIRGTVEGKKVLNDLGYTDMHDVLEEDLASGEDSVRSYTLGDLSDRRSQEYYREVVTDLAISASERVCDNCGSGYAYGMGYADWCDPETGIGAILESVDKDPQMAASLSPQGVSLRSDLLSVRDAIRQKFGEPVNDDEKGYFDVLTRFGMVTYAYSVFDHSFPNEFVPLDFDDGFRRLDAAYDDLVSDVEARSTAQAFGGDTQGDGFGASLDVAESVFCKGQGGVRSSSAYTYRSRDAMSNPLVASLGADALVSADRMRGAMDAVRRQGIVLGVSVVGESGSHGAQGNRASQFKDDGDVFASMSCGVHTLLRLYDDAVERDGREGTTSHVDRLRQGMLWATLVDDESRDVEDVISEFRSVDEACQKMVKAVCERPEADRDAGSLAKACGLSSRDLSLLRHVGESASKGAANRSKWPLIPNNASYGTPIVFDGGGDVFIRTGRRPGIRMDGDKGTSYDARDVNVLSVDEIRTEMRKMAQRSDVLREVDWSDARDAYDEPRGVVRDGPDSVDSSTAQPEQDGSEGPGLS